MADQLLTTSPDQFSSIRLSVASPDQIEEWSHGEVIKPETINYRTQRPERDGLFDERIFGPTKDFECYCGKYKKIRYKGVVCDKCGVEVTRSAVRRERMGHINLAVPIAHIWYSRGVPSILGLLLDLSVADLERIIYFAMFIVLEVKLEQVEQSILDLQAEYDELKKSNQLTEEIETEYRHNKQLLTTLCYKKLLSESDYHELSLKFGSILRVGIGTEAIFELLKNMDLKSEIDDTLVRLPNTSDGSVVQRKLYKRLRLLTDMNEARLRPEWLILIKLPVIPPDLRPMVQLDGGRFAASDLNDLYRRVLNRNNRLKKLIASGAPEVITRNEKRMLQEAVDALIDNAARRGRSPQTTGAGTRTLRSLSDMLRGKQGRFRQNLLGKRVDYSGRSVIVVGPQLKLHQCGLPKIMALELYKPFVISKLISEGFVHNVKNASKLIEEGAPEVWDILERVTKDSYVLLNRAPTLHRLGIQAFQPVLIEGKAIQIHPLVCHAYNADFDGDQMAVHLPLSPMANYEAREIMKSSHNLIKPASGDPVVQARFDIVFGCYYLTTFKPNAKGEGKSFASKNEAILAYHQNIIDVRAQINVRMSDELVETSVGRIMFNNILPEDMEFDNRIMDNKALKKLISSIYSTYGVDETAAFVDRMKDIGFEYAAVSGLTISIADIEVPHEKAMIIKDSDELIAKIEKQYNRGLITSSEKEIGSIEVWNKAKNLIETSMIDGYDKQNPVYLTVASGARGSYAQILQMGGMKGLVVNPAGEIIPLPIKASFKEGLDVYEYFLSTHGARKGRSDTSLRTSDAGYLTRRLVDVTQDIVITEKDCNGTDFINISKTMAELSPTSFKAKILSRFTSQDIKSNSKLIATKDTIISEELADLIANDESIESIQVRSPLTCSLAYGVCQKCYGYDMAILKTVRIGEPVGIVAAQAIGEPGTQLTMKTFHMGGVTGVDITSGLPRVEELFECRLPKRSAPIAEIGGVVKIVDNKSSIDIIVTSRKIPSVKIEVPIGFETKIESGATVKAKQIIAVKAGENPIRAKTAGKVTVKENFVTISDTSKETITYNVTPSSTLLVSDGQEIEKGALLTDDHVNLHTSLELRGVELTQNYIIDEVQKIYAAQGQDIHDKHIELIVRQMFSKARIDNGGESRYVSGQIIDASRVKNENDKLVKSNKKPIISEQIILGISRVALKTDSFLSAASFQETTSVLIDAAVRGASDYLKGLKENVILGRLIPAGTGYNPDYGKPELPIKKVKKVNK